MLCRWGDAQSTRYGDIHYYNSKVNMFDADTYPRPRFVSEFGFQSWPSWPVYKQATALEDWSLHSNMTDFR